MTSSYTLIKMDERPGNWLALDSDGHHIAEVVKNTKTGLWHAWNTRAYGQQSAVGRTRNDAIRAALQGPVAIGMYEDEQPVQQSSSMYDSQNKLPKPVRPRIRY